MDRVLEQIDAELGLDPFSHIKCSAKQGIGIEEVLEAIVERIPPPKGDPAKPLSALIFDAQYDSFRGTVIYCRVFDGAVKPGDIIRFMSKGSTHKVEEVGRFALTRDKKNTLSAGDVGYIIAGVKTVSDVRIGDTITLDERPADQRLFPGSRRSSPSFSRPFTPSRRRTTGTSTDALEKYKLNDAALVYQKDSSVALGQGFRCGFLGLLHLEIVQERLEREFDQSIILSVPSVRYRFTLKDGSVVWVDNPSNYPDPSSIEKAEEPFIRATMIMPERYLGAVMKLCTEKRGANSTMSYLSPGRVEIIYEMPLAEVLFDFYDRLKTVTQGYGSFDYDIIDYREGDARPSGHPGQRREGGRPLPDRPPRQRPSAGRPCLRQAQGRDPPSAVQDRDPGSNRR